MLDSLIISDVSLNPSFNSKIYEYEVEVPNSTSFLSIDYESKYPVTIYGADALYEGENHVLIEVYDNEKVTTYKIKVTRQKEEAVFKMVDKKENSINPVWEQIMLPTIGGTSFLLILLLFCIIFKRK